MCIISRAVIKMEELERGGEGRFLNAFLREDVVLEEKHMNVIGSSNLTDAYFDMLDKEDVTALYKIYEPDFKMFGYTFSFKGLSFP